MFSIESNLIDGLWIGTQMNEHIVKVSIVLERRCIVQCSASIFIDSWCCLGKSTAQVSQNSCNKMNKRNEFLIESCRNAHRKLKNDCLYHLWFTCMSKHCRNVKRCAFIWRYIVTSDGKLTSIQCRLQITQITIASGHVNATNFILSRTKRKNLNLFPLKIENASNGEPYKLERFPEKREFPVDLILFRWEIRRRHLKPFRPTVPCHVSISLHLISGETRIEQKKESFSSLLAGGWPKSNKRMLKCAQLAKKWIKTIFKIKTSQKKRKNLQNNKKKVLFYCRIGQLKYSVSTKKKRFKCDFYDSLFVGQINEKTKILFPSDDSFGMFHCRPTERCYYLVRHEQHLWFPLPDCVVH